MHAQIQLSKMLINFNIIEACKVVKVYLHAHIINISNIWREVFRFMPRSLYSREKKIPQPMLEDCLAPGTVRTFWKKEHIWLLFENDPPKFPSFNPQRSNHIYHISAVICVNLISEHKMVMKCYIMLILQQLVQFLSEIWPASIIPNGTQLGEWTLITLYKNGSKGRLRRVQ